MAFGMDDFENPDYNEEPTAFSDEESIAAKGWDELADQQRANAEMQQMNANRKAFDQYIAIEDGAKQQKLALDHQRAIAGAAMIQSAFRNGGMSDRSLSAAFSQAFGRPIYGGQLIKGMDIGNGPETVFAMYGATKDPRTGKATVAPVAMMGSREMLQIMKRAGLGDATNDLQNDIIDNSYLGKLTDDQRAAMGVSRPSAPITTGTTVISGSAMRRLRGLPRQRNNEGGHFAADGRGGFTKSYFNRSTGENWEVDYGTRDPARRAAKWKVLESHADYTRYENDLTGEVVRVPKGSSLRDVLRGSSERERVAQIQAQGRENAAAIRAAGRGTASGGAGAVKVDKDLIAAVKEMRAAYAPKIQNDADEMVDNPNADPEMFRRYSDRLNQLLLGGGEGTQGSEGMTPQQRAQAILTARRQNGGGATEPENTASTPAQGGGESGGAGYGFRNDGKTYKGTGWLGELRLPDGGVATEYTMQSDAVRDANGNRIDFPTLVPTLTKAEQDLMVNDIIPNRKPVPDEIAQKAVDFARMRLANGQSVFANDGQPPAQGVGRAATATAARQPKVLATSESVRDELSRSGKLTANAEKVDDKAIENLSLKDRTTLRLAKKAWEHIKNGLKLPEKSPDTAADASLRFLGKFFTELDERGVNFDTSAANTRSEREIQEDPHDGDRLPLEGGGYAVFNAKTDMWEALNDEGGRGNGGIYA